MAEIYCKTFEIVSEYPADDVRGDVPKHASPEYHEIALGAIIRGKGFYLRILLRPLTI